MPEHFSRAPSQMHRWLAARLDAAQHDTALPRGWRINVLAPRGGAKSTLVTLAYVLRAAVTVREPYIWIVSDTRHQAAGHLENVKAELLDNPRLARDYPRAVGLGPRWRGNLIQLNNGVTIEAVGTAQRIRGRRLRANRPTLIVCDDLQNDGHAVSPRLRDVARRWFHGLLLPAGTKRTNVLNLATALHREALALELLRTPGWESRVFAAIVRWPERMDLWERWEALLRDPESPDAATVARAYYDEHATAMNADAELLWPEEEDLYTLMSHRAMSGRVAFDREKQNIPAQPESCEWPGDYFAGEIWFHDWPANLRIKAMALDPSKGRDARHGDYSAFVLLGIDERGIVYLEADLARRPTARMVADGVAWYRQFQPHLFGIETNQFQELLAAEFQAEFLRQGMLAAAVVPLENTAAKLARIRRWGPLFAQRRVRFKANSPGTRMLLEQFQDFPHAAHDDGPDAAEMALRLACER